MYYRLLCALLFFLVFSSIFVYCAFIYSAPPWNDGELVFEENFQGKSLNSNRWEFATDFNVNTGPGRDKKASTRKLATGEESNYGNYHIQVENGDLQISPRSSPSPEIGKILKSVQVHQKDAGFSHGAFIVRAKFSKHKFICSQIRLLYADNCFRNEITLVKKPAETLILDDDDNNNKKLSTTTSIIFGASVGVKVKNSTNITHVTDKGEEEVGNGRMLRRGNNNNTVRVAKNVGFSTSNFDLHKDYHEYGIKWTKNKLTWFFDNRQYYEMSLNPKAWTVPGSYHHYHAISSSTSGCLAKTKRQPFFSKPMKFVIDLYVYPGYSEDVTKPTPPSMNIDWIRVYKMK